MAIKDLQNFKSENAFDRDLPMASAADRITSFFIDLVILTPFAHLLFSSLLKKIEYLGMVARDSTELIALTSLLVAAGFVCHICYQTLCWTLWGATPGKYFLKLKIVSIAEENTRLSGKSETLSASQALVRSLIWNFELVFLALPFVEIFSHIKRRPLHDRAAETFVVNLKQESYNHPHRIESHFIKQFLIVSFGVFCAWSFVGLAKVYQMAMNGSFHQDELQAAGALCQQVSDSSENRVDEALALFLAGEVTSDCVELETNFFLWTPGSTYRSWAYLARGLVSRDNSQLSQNYLNKACEISSNLDSKSSYEACEISKQFQMSQERSKVNFSEMSSLTAKILNLERLERLGQTDQVALEVKKFPSDNFKEALASYLLRSVWANHDIEKARGIFVAQQLSASRASSLSMASWLCLQEMQIQPQTCGSSEACHRITQEPASTQLETAWAQIKQRDCHGTNLSDLNREFREVFHQNPDLHRLAQALVSSTNENLDRKRGQLEGLVKTRQGILGHLALSELIPIVKTTDQWELIKDILEKQKNHDWSWQQNVLKAFQRSYDLKDYKIAQAFSLMSDSDFLQKWKLTQESIVSAFRANDRKLAYRRWLESKKAVAPASESLRRPAAADQVAGDVTWKEVEAALIEMNKTRVSSQ